jgi:hypothetical protein
MTADALQLRRARRAIYGPPITGLVAAVLTLVGVYGLVTNHRSEAAAVRVTTPTLNLIAPQVIAHPTYALVTADGNLFVNATTATSGAASKEIVGASRRLDGGFWLASADGHVYVSGSRTAHSIDLPAHAARIVAIASARRTPGYWLAAADGHVYAEAGADKFPAVRTRSPVVGIAAAPGGGYWLATRDGHVYAIGTPPIGDIAGERSGAQIVGIAPGPILGYWLAASDGRVYAFGTQPITGVRGTTHAPIIAIASTDTGGFWLTTADGTVYALGGAPQLGSLSGKHGTVVGITAR